MHDIDIGSEGESYEMGGEEEYEEGQLGEADETEMAAELLSASNEAELEQFLGDLVKKVGGAIGSVVKGPGLNFLTNQLKSLASKALPQVGSAIGGMIGGSTGSKIGGALASQAGRAFGLELEGLSSEEAEFETAKAFCRYATEATKKFLQKQGTTTPAAAARIALQEAAKQHAPGLVPLLRAGDGLSQKLGAGTHSGRWFRRGNKLIVIGA